MRGLILNQLSSVALPLWILVIRNLVFVRSVFLFLVITKKLLQAFTRSDVFSTTELAEIASRYSTVVIDKGDVVRQWRTNLAKYSKFPGIREKHDFLFVKCSVSGKVLAKTCGMCFKGTLENAKMHIVKGYTPEENVIPSREETYENTNRLRQISSTKLGHLQQMYTNFIPQERHDPTIMQ